jgi:hypothetical protein
MKDKMTDKELEIESQRAWEDKKREQSREAIATHREYAGKGFDFSREDIEEARGGR